MSTHSWAVITCCMLLFFKNLLHVETPQLVIHFQIDDTAPKKSISQSVGFEPTLPEGIWFLVRRLNHSATTADFKNEVPAKTSSALHSMSGFFNNVPAFDNKPG